MSITCFIIVVPKIGVDLLTGFNLLAIVDNTWKFEEIYEPNFGSLFRNFHDSVFLSPLPADLNSKKRKNSSLIKVLRVSTKWKFIPRKKVQSHSVVPSPPASNTVPHQSSQFPASLTFPIHSLKVFEMLPFQYRVLSLSPKFDWLISSYVRKCIRKYRMHFQALI